MLIKIRRVTAPAVSGSVWRAGPEATAFLPPSDRLRERAAGLQRLRGAADAPAGRAGGPPLEPREQRALAHARADSVLFAGRSKLPGAGHDILGRDAVSFPWRTGALAVLKQIAADIRNMPANYKAQRLLLDGLGRYARQHYERKRIAGRQGPTNPGSGGRIC